MSFACKQQELVPVREKKRPRKPSPQRNKQLSPAEQLDEFLVRGCRCAGKCSEQFDREEYTEWRDEAFAMTRDELDKAVLIQIRCFTSMDDVVGPSHKHMPTQRQRTRAQFFYHAGRKICRDTFLIVNGIGKVPE